MNAAGDAPDEGLTTEQIAAAGASPVQERAAREAQSQPGAQTAPPAQRPADGTSPGSAELAGQGSRFDGGPAGGADERDRSSPVGAAASAGEGSGLATGREPRSRLLEDDELQRIVTRWQEIQGEFVDEPGNAVKHADMLVGDLMQRLAGMFARERADLEQRWAGGAEVSTEDLRQSLRLYRSFFERLLAA